MSNFIFDYISLPKLVILIVIWGLFSFYYRKKFESWTIKKLDSLEESVQEIKNDISDLKSSMHSLESQIETLEDDLTPDDIKIQKLVDMGFPSDMAWEHVKFKKNNENDNFT